MEPIPSYAGLKIKEKRKVKIDRPCNVAVSEGNKLSREQKWPH